MTARDKLIQKLTDRKVVATKNSTVRTGCVPCLAVRAGQNASPALNMRLRPAGA